MHAITYVYARVYVCGRDPPVFGGHPRPYAWDRFRRQSTAHDKHTLLITAMCSLSSSPQCCGRCSPALPRPLSGREAPICQGLGLCSCRGPRERFNAEDHSIPWMLGQKRKEKSTPYGVVSLHPHTLLTPPNRPRTHRFQCPNSVAELFSESALAAAPG